MRATNCRDFQVLEVLHAIGKVVKIASFEHFMLLAPIISSTVASAATLSHTALWSNFTFFASSSSLSPRSVRCGLPRLQDSGWRLPITKLGLILIGLDYARLITLDRSPFGAASPSVYFLRTS